MKSRTAHNISFILGFLFLSLSLYQAFFLEYSHFYTSFAFGSWLVLDFIDYKLTGYSILGYFFHHRHRDAFVLFFAISTFFCFVVDYLWGVEVTGMWEWINYKPVHYLRMYLFMNASFILGMYELFRIVRKLFEDCLNINDDPILGIKIHHKDKDNFYFLLLIFGIFGMMAPSYVLVFNTKLFVEYAMLLPFISLILVSDGVTHMAGGVPILEKIIHLKKLDILALLVTSFIGSGITEFLNLQGNEWRYVTMPFPNFVVFNVPVAVFIGWIPLVIGSIAIINMVKHLDYVIDHARK